MTISIINQLESKNMKLNKKEIENLLDALIEYEEIIGCKELNENEIGLNYDSFINLKNKLEREKNES